MPKRFSVNLCEELLFVLQNKTKNIREMTNFSDPAHILQTANRHEWKAR